VLERGEQRVGFCEEQLICFFQPERSVVLDITCGVKNELLSIVEPCVCLYTGTEAYSECSEKCEYHFKVTSPGEFPDVHLKILKLITSTAACWPLEGDTTKDEL
jgi:hypothetical protein